MKTGRPVGPSKVVYKRRVLPAMVSVLDSLLSRPETTVESNLKPSDAPVAVVIPPEDNNGLKSQIKALLDRSEKDAVDIQYWKDRFEKCTRAGESGLVVYWRTRAEKAEAELKKNNGEYTQ